MSRMLYRRLLIVAFGCGAAAYLWGDLTSDESVELKGIITTFVVCLLVAWHRRSIPLALVTIGFAGALLGEHLFTGGDYGWFSYGPADLQRIRAETAQRELRQCLWTGVLTALGSAGLLVLVRRSPRDPSPRLAILAAVLALLPLISLVTAVEPSWPAQWWLVYLLVSAAVLLATAATVLATQSRDMMPLTAAGVLVTAVLVNTAELLGFYAPADTALYVGTFYLPADLPEPTIWDRLAALTYLTWVMPVLFFVAMGLITYVVGRRRGAVTS